MAISKRQRILTPKFFCESKTGMPKKLKNMYFDLSSHYQFICSVWFVFIHTSYFRSWPAHRKAGEPLRFDTRNLQIVPSCFIWNPSLIIFFASSTSRLSNKSGTDIFDSFSFAKCLQSSAAGYF